MEMVLAAVSPSSWMVRALDMESSRFLRTMLLDLVADVQCMHRVASPVFLAWQAPQFHSRP